MGLASATILATDARAQSAIRMAAIPMWTVAVLASVGLLLGITLVAYLPMAVSRGGLLGRPKEMSAEQRRAVAKAFAFDAKDHPWLLAAPWEERTRVLPHRTIMFSLLRRIRVAR